MAFGTESQFIVSYYKRIHHFEPLEDYENLNRLVDSLLAERWFRYSRKFNDFQLTRQQIVDAVKDRTFAGVLDTIFRLFAENLGMSRWGDKTPGYISHLDVIYKLFPDAVYVYLVRDGATPLCLNGRCTLVHRTCSWPAREWRQSVRKSDRFVKGLPSKQLFTLRYEDLLRDPVSNLTHLGQFLDPGGSEESLKKDWQSTAMPDINRKNMDKWRSVFSESQKRAFERIACDELRRHGYDTFIGMQRGNIRSVALLLLADIE